MDRQKVTVRSVHHDRPTLQRITTAELPTVPAPAHVRIDDCPSLTSSISDAPTVIRWITPTSRRVSPQASFETIKPEVEPSIATNEATYPSNNPLAVRFDEDQIRNTELVASKREERMENVDQELSPPTPMDDTPYIRFAIDQLTRDEEVKSSQRPSTSTSSESYPVDRIVPDYGLGYMTSQKQREELALTRKHRSTPPGTPEGRLFNFNATRPLSKHSKLSPLPPQETVSVSPDIFIPVDPPLHTPRYPNLTFVPTILRPTSMITLAILCLLMITALMFSAIYSTYHHGLFGWAGGIHGGRYVLFGFLPQIVSACIFVYVQGVMSATTRILPYTLMAIDDAYMRTNALFLGIYPGSMLWPRWNGPLSINISNSLFWLTIFTIPLQSCLFSVVLVDGIWRWTIVQGVAWTLVAVYILVLVAIVISGLFFFRRTTGLMWDPRTLADTTALLPRSNCLGDYAGTDVLRDQEDLRERLAVRSDRLGYWMTQHRGRGLFYCIGEEGTSTRRYTLQSGRIHEKNGRDEIEQNSDVEKSADLYNTETRFQYLPWMLRDTFVVLWAVAAFITLIALIVVSSLPSTGIWNGFPPLVPVVPNASGFSPANFLHSFVPSILGMLLYIFLQPLDMAIRKLQPWVELGNTEGSTADRSLLLDYTAALPIQCSISALRHGHYRVASVSLISFLSLLLPVLGGGLFFPLTTENEVRMLPNLPAFYICLAVLIFYVLALFILLPKRALMSLPHGVDCLAEIISFVHGSRMLEDAAFRAPRSKADLASRLMATQDGGRHTRYGFGLYKGRHGKLCMGIDKLGRPGAAGVLLLNDQ
ncbi:Uncharacterized protein BP5553_06706 [Venustampulla echinocandica]|uniref:Phosphoribosylaminoimidazole-succinocarboxamide synthase n=1 Tax=Venustampulla echinocandica TaxID=2656787 RepID=A0A370TKQ1_9HELO|nr:Uncharacterized protein BP5553_06706 [Venustampulla echinocandica]RDL36094.1 Uncharacterized protein BP5553_06706 [Venustampulla echinocandica]